MDGSWVLLWMRCRQEVRCCRDQLYMPVGDVSAVDDVLLPGV